MVSGIAKWHQYLLYDTLLVLETVQYLKTVSTSDDLPARGTTGKTKHKKRLTTKGNLSIDVIGVFIKIF